MKRFWLFVPSVFLIAGACKSPASPPAQNSPSAQSSPSAQTSGAVHQSPTAAPEAASIKKLEITDKNRQRLGELEQYPSLESLSISCIEDLRALPGSIGQLKNLKELKIDNGNGCSMNPVLPESLGNLASLETLILDGAQDPRGPGPQPRQRNEFPRSMSSLKRLTHLNLARNGFKQVPVFVKDLPQLKELDLNFNDLNDLPEFLNTFPDLTLTLGDNCSITGNKARKKDLQRRFPKIKFKFDDEYDCPEQSN